jgi:hypothetical protein
MKILRQPKFKGQLESLLTRVVTFKQIKTDNLAQQYV